MSLFKFTFYLKDLFNCEKVNDYGVKQQTKPGNQISSYQPLPPPSPASNYYSYLRCWRCDYDDADQCVKNFDFTKHKHEACDGKCLKAFEKVQARTKLEIEKDQSELIS